MPFISRKFFFSFKSKVCLIFTLGLFIFGSCATPALAQNSPASTQSTQQVLNSLLNSFAGCMIIGQSLIETEECPSQSGSQSSNHPNSGMGLVGKAISLTYNPPLSTQAYLADVKESLGFAKPAYAQSVTGTGESVIAPVKKLWQITRNFSYLIFTLIFVGVGVMIMLRRKLNPQTVLSVQSALPGLVIGLILLLCIILVHRLCI